MSAHAKHRGPASVAAVIAAREAAREETIRQLRLEVQRQREQVADLRRQIAAAARQRRNTEPAS